LIFSTNHKGAGRQPPSHSSMLKGLSCMKASDRSFRPRAILPALFAILAVLLSSCTVVKIGEQPAGGSSAGEADVASYARDTWERVVSYVNEHAHDLPDVMETLLADSEKAVETYGVRNASAGSAWNFIIKGQGKITAVHTESRAGTAEIDVPPYDGEPDAALQIGPVFKGTSIRDSLDFVNFDQFKNQIDFAKLAAAYNTLVLENVIDAKGTEWFQSGKEIRFVGVFTENGRDILITPVELDETGGGA